MVLAGLLLIASLLIVQPGRMQSTSNVGLNGDPCAYDHIAVAIVDAEDGNTVYVDVGQVYTGTGIGLVQKDVTIAAATDNCQTPTNTLAIVDGGGRRPPTDGGMMTVDKSHTVKLSHVRLQNTQADRGGVVDINEDGTLILEASGIASGTAGIAGGGVYVGVGASLIMCEGSAVFANSVTETTSWGGGIYAISGTITMTDSYLGEFVSGQGNTSADRGGGVFLDRSSLYLDNSMILANNAVEGGGVYAQNDSVVETAGDSVIGDSLSYFLGNYADDGAGVYLDRDSVLLMRDDSQLSYNLASDFGEGVYVGLGSTVDMDGAGTRIYNNTATFGGGAVVSGTSSSLYIFGGAQIVDNYAAGSVASGGGLAIRDGRVFIADSRISYNTAITHGGGIQQMGGVLTMTYTALDANSAEQGGGLYVEGAASVLDNVLVLYNRAAGDGGGIFAGAGSDLRMDADFSDCNPLSLAYRVYCSEVSSNEAAGQGAGVYVEDGTAFIGHTASLSNNGDFSYSHGAALMVGTGAHVTATDTLFTGHGASGETTVHVYNQATYHSENSTYAGNPDVPLFVVSQGTADLKRNIIWENGAAPTLQGSIDSYCNDTESGILTGPADFSEDPQFRGVYAPAIFSQSARNFSSPASVKGLRIIFCRTAKGMVMMSAPANSDSFTCLG